MTPILNRPSHVTSDGQMFSNVFHANIPGAIVAVFRGPNHMKDSEEFCAAYGQEGISMEEYREQVMLGTSEAYFGGRGFRNGE